MRDGSGVVKSSAGYAWNVACQDRPTGEIRLSAGAEVSADGRLMQ